jgi:hypothetical protein
VDGYAYGSLSMACYGVDVAAPAVATDARGAGAALPDPDEVPTELTNL